MSVNPLNITNPDRSPHELEEFLLFAVAVAGKPAVRTAAILNPVWGCNSPFGMVRAWIREGALEDYLRRIRLGQYARIAKAWTEVVNQFRNGWALRLELVDPEVLRWKLIEIPGIGMKTASFFCVHAGKGVRMAVLDRHILQSMQYAGWEVPSVSPNNPDKYLEIEELWLEHFLPDDRSAAEVDLEEWRRRMRKEVLRA